MREGRVKGYEVHEDFPGHATYREKINEQLTNKVSFCISRLSSLGSGLVDVSSTHLAEYQLDFFTISRF